jgi:adenosylhomocysteinase
MRFAMPSLDDLAFEAERDIGTTKAFFPILPTLGNRWAARRPWEGMVVGLNVHLTTLTASLVQELMLGGATCVVSAANPGTTDPGTVQLLRNQGVEVYTGGDMEDRHLQVLAHSPTLLIDSGYELVTTCLEKCPERAALIRGAVELTKTGIDRMRAHAKAPFPVVNAHDIRLRDAFQHRHGIGQAIWEAVGRLTGMQLSGRRVAVLGYGHVGRGIAAWGRNTGMAIEVVELDPVRRLYAHYDGFPTPTLRDALSRVDLVVTATGKRDAVPLDMLADARDRVVLLNAGTGGSEVDVKGIKRNAERVDHIADGVIRYRLETGRTVTVLGDGHPLNIVLNSGSPEPVLLHFAVAGLAIEWVATAQLEWGEVAVPEALEDEAARIALKSLGITDA